MKNTHSILDIPCRVCGEQPARYRKVGRDKQWHERICDKCAAKRLQRSSVQRSQRSAAVAPFKIIDRACVKCGVRPAWFPAHLGNADGYRLDCVECQQRYRKAYRQRPEVRAVTLPYLRRYSKTKIGQISLEAFAAYGGFCYCCGIDDPAFLTLDHIDEQGAQHRREVKRTGFRMYEWAKKNGWPPIFRVACFNCNCARSLRGGGICPHEQRRQELLAA